MRRRGSIGGYGGWGGPELLGLGIIILFVVLIVGSFVNALHTETMTCTVEDKDRTTNSDGKSDARIYTEDCGVLRTGDSLFSWQWNSADVYASIEPGHTYTVTTRGYRVPIFSWFPNVVGVEEVSPDA